MSTTPPPPTNKQAPPPKTGMVAPKDLGKPASGVKELGIFIESMKSQFALALPKHLNADRMMRLAMTVFSTNSKIQKCSMKSIAAAVMTATQLGLEIGVNGQAYMVPYGTTATFVPGWKGLIDLANRAGRASAWTGAAFVGDEFEWALGDSPYIKHRPKGESDPDKLLYAYAVGRVNGSDWPVIECWTNERLTAHRDKYNKVGNAHYSYENWEMYARKVVLLQVLKYLPSSIELTAAIELANREDEPRSVILDGDFIAIELEDDSHNPVLDGPKTETPTEGAKAEGATN